MRLLPILLGLSITNACATAQEDAIPMENLQDLLRNIRVAPHSITVSGLSSGAFMAHQLHVAYSSRIVGAGLIAGGPYRCAKEHFWGSFFDPSGLYAATSVCTRSASINISRSKPHARFSIKEAKKMASKKTIDSTKNLNGSKIWLFTGGNDRKVPEATMDALYGFYKAFTDNGNINYVHHKTAGHAMPTLDYGNRCNSSSKPYINACGYDAAGGLLRHLYGPLNNKTKARIRSLKTFEQSAYFDPEDVTISLSRKGLIYIPSSCEEGSSCRLHVALHGCQQNLAAIGNTFALHAGYNEWAEANNIIILYPQTSNWKYNDPHDFQRNPRGCWDWWGYTGERYSERSGKQMSAIMQMVEAIIGVGTTTFSP